MRLPRLPKNMLFIIYKLLNDLLFLLLSFFVLMLIAEGLIPGIISLHVSFLRITTVIFLDLYAIYFIGSFLKVSFEKQFLNKKTAIFLAVLGILLIFNSLLKLNLALAVFILLVIVITGYFIYKNIFD